MDSVGCAGVSVCDNNFFKEAMNLRGAETSKLLQWVLKGRRHGARFTDNNFLKYHRVLPGHSYDW